MAVDFTGVFHSVIHNLSLYVWGSYDITCTVLILFFFIVSVLIGIPPLVCLALPIPFAVVLAAFGYMTPLVAGIMGASFLVMGVAAAIAGVGISR